MSKWKTINHGTSVDVVPIGDKDYGYGDECWCSPTIEKTEGVPLITHNEHIHNWGEWMDDDQAITIDGKQRMLSIRSCESCSKVQARIGTVTEG